MTIRVLDPTFEESISTVAKRNRLTSLSGCSIGFLDNGKPNSREFFDQLEPILRSEYGVSDVLRFMKPDSSRPAPPELIAEVSRCDAVISGVGD
jgi:hypothetical protein